jgi:hypothetical protein
MPTPFHHVEYLNYSTSIFSKVHESCPVLCPFPRECTLTGYRLLNYIKITADFGNHLKPDAVWDGIDKTFEFVISGRSDSEYASDPDEGRSVSGGTVFLNGAVIHAFSRMQRSVTLSVTEVEFVAAVDVVQNRVTNFADS